jgi:hypothetical protein
MKMKIKSIHPLQWITEPLESHPLFVQKKMFGGEIVGLHGKQVLFFIAKDEPWNGLFVCTSREHHPSLIKEHPSLKPHTILGKWLYISQTHRTFETVAMAITKDVLQGDPRIGVESKPRKKKKMNPSTATRGKKGKSPK